MDQGGTTDFGSTLHHFMVGVATFYSTLVPAERICFLTTRCIGFWKDKESEAQHAFIIYYEHMLKMLIMIANLRRDVNKPSSWPQKPMFYSYIHFF